MPQILKLFFTSNFQKNNFNQTLGILQFIMLQEVFFLFIQLVVAIVVHNILFMLYPLKWFGSNHHLWNCIPCSISLELLIGWHLGKVILCSTEGFFNISTRGFISQILAPLVLFFTFKGRCAIKSPFCIKGVRSQFRSPIFFYLTWSVGRNIFWTYSPFLSRSGRPPVLPIEEL